MNARGNRNLGVLAAALLLFAQWSRPAPARAQEPAGNRHQEIEQLRLELRRLNARLDALEAADAASSTAASPGTITSAAAAPAASVPGVATQAESKPVAARGADAVRQAGDAGMDTMDAGMGGETINIPHVPELKIRGFGDVRFFVADQNLAEQVNNPGTPTPDLQAGRSTFALGLMDLFITSQISEKFSYLAEVGFEAEKSSNGVGVDLERAQLSFTPSDKFSVSVGRTHAMLGYYNTAFHHGTWFQTTIDRPQIFQFEDSGGPLPVHNVGISAMGKIPGGLGVHWFAELGNGKQTYSLAATVTPANVLADHTGKSTNLGFYIKPERFSGLRAGFNWYQASLVPALSLLPSYGTPDFPFPNAVSYYKQNIFMAHVVYITPTLEFMVEDAEIRDLPRGSVRPLYTSGGYAQVSRVFGNFRPYFRYQWLNPNFNDPNNAWVGRWVGPNAGVRWDLNTFIALKLEYSNFDWKNFSSDSSGNQMLPIQHKTINQLGTQITYTF